MTPGESDCGFPGAVFICRSIRLFVKFRIESIEVAAVKLILYDPQAFAESLVMYDLTLSQEADRIAHLRVFDKAEDIVVGRPGFLLSGQVLAEICDRIPF